MRISGENEKIIVSTLYLQNPSLDRPITSKETHTNYVTNTEITEATASVRSSRESLARSASGPRNNLCLWERATSDVPYLPRNLLADKTPVSHQPGWRRGAKGRGIEERDVSACRSGLFILSPADTPAMILTRRGEAFSPKEKKRRRDGRGGVRKRERYVTREAEEVAESFFFHAFRGKCV